MWTLYYIPVKYVFIHPLLWVTGQLSWPYAQHHKMGSSQRWYLGVGTVVVLQGERVSSNMGNQEEEENKVVHLLIVQFIIELDELKNSNMQVWIFVLFRVYF